MTVQENIIFESTIPDKKCSKCGEVFPADTDFFCKNHLTKDGLQYQCKKCRNNWKDWSTVRKKVKPGYKKCPDCGKVLKATSEFFTISKREKDGLRRRCKKCCNNWDDWPKEQQLVKAGEKKCSKCGNVFPATHDFFGVDIHRIDGFRGLCKKCTNHWKEWPEKKEEIKKGYKKCPKCGGVFIANVSNFGFRKDRKDKLSAWCKGCQKESSKAFSESNPEKVKKWQRDYRKLDKNNKIKNYYINNKDHHAARTKKYLRKKCLFSYVQVEKLSVYEDIEEDKNGFLNVPCAYCGKKIIPTIQQVILRVRTCESPSLGGECRIYCNNSEDGPGCREACPTYGQIKYPKGFKPATSREATPWVRQECFKRDNYTCQKCGAKIKDVQLHCHHIVGVAHSPMEQQDLSNTVTLCKPCHKALHKKPGCTYKEYRCA